MKKYASEIVKVMQSWIGRNEAAGTHKAIIDIYNAHKPLPRCYKVKYTDEWCATTTSAAAIKLGYTDIIPIECSCSKIIAKAKEMGIWVEDESATPKAGWLCIYDWQDSSGKKDNKGDPDHIGLVEKVTGNTFVVIEGNYSNSVKRRTLEINGKYLRGFVAPKYDTEKATKPAAKKSITTIAKEVLAGKWGNGDERKKKLKAAGYDPAAVQKEVNKLCKPAKLSISAIAKEVAAGRWGNGDTRKKKLKAAGYSDAEIKQIQAAVNKLLP